MKIITKKSVIFTALAVVLLTTALVISCNAPTTDGISDNEEPSIPGTGKVRLTIKNRDASRTIQPAGLSGIRYLVILTGKTGGGPGGLGNSNTFYKTVTSGTDVPVSNIPEGTYASAQVIAYMKDGTALGQSDGGGFLSYAIGESSVDNGIGGNGFVINDGGITPLGTFNVSLYTPGVNTGNGAGGLGSFTYAITDASSTIDQAKYVILGRSPTPNFLVTPTDVTFVDQTVLTPITSVTVDNIPSGYYNVVYTLTDTASHTAYFYEILHVYKNMESLLTFTFTDAIFPVTPPTPGNGNGEITITPPGNPHITVTFGLDSNSSSSDVIISGQNGYGWNVQIRRTATNPDLKLEVSVPSSGVTFGAWNLVNSSGVNPIVANGTNGITITLTSTQERTIQINTANASLPLPTVSNDYYYTTQEVTYNGKNFNSPAIYIKFID